MGGFPLSVGGLRDRYIKKTFPRSDREKGVNRPSARASSLALTEKKLNDARLGD